MKFVKKNDKIIIIFDEVTDLRFKNDMEILLRVVNKFFHSQNLLLDTGTFRWSKSSRGSLPRRV